MSKKKGQKLTLNDLIQWKEWTPKNESAVEAFLSRFNSYLEKKSFPVDELCEILAETYFNFLTIQPREKEIAHLLVNYLLSAFERPLFEFSEEELKTLNSVRLYMGKKLRENVQVRGRLYKLKEDYQGLTARYVDPATGEEILVEWHPLFSKEREWCRESA